MNFPRHAMHGCSAWIHKLSRLHSTDTGSGLCQALHRWQYLPPALPFCQLDIVCMESEPCAHPCGALGVLAMFELGDRPDQVDEADLAPEMTPDWCNASQGHPFPEHIAGVSTLAPDQSSLACRRSVRGATGPCGCA